MRVQIAVHVDHPAEVGRPRWETNRLLLHRRELTLLASRNALAPDFTRIIKLIEDGRIDTRPWMTHHADFDGMIAEFPNWLKPETGVIKAIVTVE